ncbi:MAG: ABC transporter substrate-binding protein [Prevotella sp.]|nr:ABC transporter substrate-binding protein [Prevotella sp.]
MKKKTIIPGIIAVILLSTTISCRMRSHKIEDMAGDTLQMKYATLLHIVQHDGGATTVTIDNPWKEGSTLHKYLLVDKDSVVPDHAPNVTVIRTPVSRSVMFTSAHTKLLEWLHAEQSVAGVADLKYMLLPWVQEGVKTGKIADCGDAMSPLIEKIIDIGPDIIMLSPFENSGGYGRLESIGIPYVECADYMEKSALGRAEWMRFYGMLLGKEREADSLFAVVDSAYHALKAKAATAKSRPSIITEKLTGSTWYVAGGRSTVGQLIADANGSYAWADDTHSGSLAMTFETVLDRAGNADLWIFNSSPVPCQYELVSEYAGYEEMHALKTSNVWCVDTQRTPYFEEVSFHPDYLLREYIILLHPEMGLGEPKYYEIVQECCKRE